MPGKGDEMAVDAKSTIETERKLNTELNQLINQRFLLTTTAITVFGTFSAFMIPKNPVAAKDAVVVGNLLISGSGCLLIFYFLLFMWNRQLLILQQTISVYLSKTSDSTWETDFRSFIRLLPVGFRIQPWVFGILGALSTAWPFVVMRSLGITTTCRHSVALIAAGLIYIAVVAYLGLKVRDDATIKATWAQILDRTPPASPERPPQA
jgi:hypothetical protein